ncbi:hypothetical protein TNCV_3043391 [Trichonephila clavipes]|nr:hypothetical protein TNCV_3043391 [Trichonephila clavipes]
MKTDGESLCVLNLNPLRKRSDPNVYVFLILCSSGSLTLQVAELNSVSLELEIVYVDDNTQLHKVALLDGYLDQEDIQHIVGLTKPPNLNFIQNVWDAPEKAVAHHQSYPRILQLLVSLLEEWKFLIQSLIRTIISNKKTHCGAFEGAQGTTTLIRSLVLCWNVSFFE